MDDELILLDFLPSMFGMRISIVLDEKEIKYEYKEQDMRKSKSELLLKLNPIYKKVPVLIHNGKPICESSIAVEYIDEVWKDKFQLLPSDPYEKAQARLWVDYIDKKLSDFACKIWTTKGNEREEAAKEFIKCLKVLEGALGNKPYFSGNNFGYVDVALIEFYSWIYVYETFGKFNIEDECPKFVEWAKRCMKRESVAKTLPDSHKVYDIVLVIREKLGLA